MFIGDILCGFWCAFSFARVRGRAINYMNGKSRLVLCRPPVLASVGGRKFFDVLFLPRPRYLFCLERGGNGVFAAVFGERF